MNQESFQYNDVNGTGTDSESPSSGRCPVEQQRRLGRHPVTADKSRRRWSKEINMVIMECYFRCKPVDENGVPVRGYRQRMYKEWQERGPFTSTEQRIADQARAIRKNGWLTDMELEGIKRKVLNDDIQEGQANVERQDLNLTMYSEESNEVNNIEEKPADDSCHWEQIRQYPELNDDENGILNRLLEIMSNKEYTEITSFKKIDRWKLNIITQKVNKVCTYIETDNITQTNSLLRAASTLVGEILGLTIRGRIYQQKEPWWKRRIERSIKELRKHISILDRERKGELRSRMKYLELNKQYKLDKKGILIVIEELKQRLQTKTAKIKRYEQRINQFRQNRLFSTDKKKFFQEIDGTSRWDKVVPNAEESLRFWGGIWSDGDRHHNKEAEWLKNLKEEYSNDDLEQENVRITIEQVKNGCRKFPNWKAPGPDGVQGFWFKRVTSCHERIARQLNILIMNNDTLLPEWMTVGRTILCQKDPTKGNEVSNFRPISCLPLMWKLMTSILANNMYAYLEENSLLPSEQKGCRRKSRGTKDQLLIDQMILRDCKRRHTNLAMAWLDYRKAYDMVPHSWILECMEMFGIAENVRKFVAGSMKRWKTKLISSGEYLGTVNIRRGIFQGDSLSPLLFVISMIPLTLILRGVNAGYEFKGKKAKVNHLFFMDDLKLFGRTKDQIDSLVKTVHLFSGDIGMTLGVNKCSVVVMKRGKLTECDGIQLPNGEVIKQVEKAGYKYLGVLELDGVMESDMKEKFRKEYFRRFKVIFKSGLNDKNKCLAANMWAVSLLRYSGGILRWTKEELKRMDTKTRKIMTIHGALHPKSDVDRIYVPRGKGGRGLISCEGCIRGEENSLGWYIRNSSEYILQVLSESNIIDTETSTEPEEFKKVAIDELKNKWREKRMYGQFVREIKEDINESKSWNWVKNSDLKSSTTALIFSAQEQALRTNYTKFHIDKTSESPLCRLCGIKGESISHLISECSKLAQKQYKERHDSVAQNIHWELCGMYGFERENKWYDHIPQSVIENEETKILWDFTIQCDRYVQNRRPDIVVIEKSKQECKIIDIAVPNDNRVGSKEQEKIEKYQDLRQEIAHLWGMKKVQVIPIVIGALGMISQRLETWLGKIGVSIRTETLQKSTLLGTARILRRTLDM